MALLLYADFLLQTKPGDFVLCPKDAPVGIAGGWDESGNIQIIKQSGYYRESQI